MNRLSRVQVSRYNQLLLVSTGTDTCGTNGCNYANSGYIHTNSEWLVCKPFRGSHLRGQNGRVTRLKVINNRNSSSPLQ